MDGLKNVKNPRTSPYFKQENSFSIKNEEKTIKHEETSIKIEKTIYNKKINQETVLNSASNTNISYHFKHLSLNKEFKDPEELFKKASKIYNPNEPIYFNTPDLSYQAKSKIQRTVPNFKRIPNTTFTVDAFSYGPIPLCKAYFLSHFHSDHYNGLRKTFSHAWIYCSKVTANLIHTKIGVKKDYIIGLELNTIYIIDGVKVILIDANHCPGSVLFLFEILNQNILNHNLNIQDHNQSYRILHTGDFRVHPSIHLHPQSLLSQLPLDYLYLDTTYCHPNYTFPTQSQIISKAIEIAEAFLKLKQSSFMGLSSTLQRWGFSIIPSISSSSKLEEIIVVGTYTLGKERLFLDLAENFQSLIYLHESNRFQILEALEDKHLISLLTKEPSKALIHVVSLWKINQKGLKAYFDEMKLHLPNLKRILGLRPTGWSISSRDAKGVTHQPKEPFNMDSIEFTSVEKKITIVELPYSEHSSYSELESFVKRCYSVAKDHGKTLKVIPTVKMQGIGELEMENHLKTWLN